MDCINKFYCYKKRKKLKQKKTSPTTSQPGSQIQLLYYFKLNTDEGLILALQNFKTSWLL